MGNQIHWFPGHMSKALREIEERIKIIDVVIEILDARAPYSSINEELEKLISNKKRLVILSKPDLADPNITPILVNKLKKTYDDVLVLNLTDNSAGKIIGKSVNRLGEDKWKKEMAKGMKPQPIRAMILGIPNVGKSSLINRLASRKAAGVQNKPGFTRGEQWIKVNKDFLLMDTPGVLPMNYENVKKAANLALIGAIREDILPNEELIKILLNYLKAYYPKALQIRYGIEEITAPNEVINQICLARNLVNNSGEKDTIRATNLLLKEFKDGKLGRFTLENDYAS